MARTLLIMYDPVTKVNSKGDEILDAVKPEAASTKNAQIESFFNKTYQFRFNVIKSKTEYKRNSTKPTEWEPMTKYTLNTFRRELDAFGITTSPANIQTILESAFAPRVNPVQEYFNTLPQWNRLNDFILEFSRTVETTNPEKWYEYLKKWLVGVVANALEDDDCKNHLCLVLTGTQGKFKTTWLDNLCPPALKNYRFTGKIKPDNKDVLTLIAEMLFINIDDQLRQLNKQDENELKNLITVKDVKYRRPYDPFITDYPHLASFCASVNGNDFLTDITGSRRFLPFEVKEIYIDKAQKFNKDNIYIQAVELYRSGFRYWFTHEEIAELHEMNEAFRVISLEEEILLNYYDVPAQREEANIFLSTGMIKTELEIATHQRLSTKKLGESLTKLGFEHWQKWENMKQNRIWVWSLIKKDSAQIEATNRGQKINDPF